MHQVKYTGLSTLVALLLFGLVGCGDKAEDNKATQVAAKVNGDEITVHQINHEMTRLGNVAPEKAKDVANQVLNSIVEQQLLAQQAVEAKLDRDPRVVQILEANRRQVLAQSYLQQITDNTAPPTDAEIKAYYTKHPELFSERRIYRLQELSVPVTPDSVEMIKAKLASSSNLNDFSRWLQEQKIPARTGQSVKTAEQLPLEVLARLHKLKDGQILPIATTNSLNIIVVAGTQSQPIGEAQAKPMIERFLVNTKKRELSAETIKNLRAKAELEYLGEYRAVDKPEAAPDSAKSADAPKLPASTESMPAAAAAPAAAPASAAPATTEQNAIDKGLQGLK